MVFLLLREIMRFFNSLKKKIDTINSLRETILIIRW
jgi:hypothetical protein